MLLSMDESIGGLFLLVKEYIADEDFGMNFLTGASFISLQVFS